MGGLSSSGLTSEVRRIPGAQRLDDTAGGTVLYFGQASAGSLESAAVWQIQRITFPTPGEDDCVTVWADGNLKYDNVWANRLTLSYS